MSKYTTEVRFICESFSGLSESKGETDVDRIISESWNKIFHDFPIFDENYRSTLCCKILKHFYLREICSETVGIWIMWLNEKMNTIMPYYNKLYESELKNIDPFKNVDYTRTSNRNITASSNTLNTGKTINKYSDTPQGTISNLENDNYLTNAEINEGNNTTNNNGTSNDEYVETISGKMNSTPYSDLLLKYRKTFINVDLMVFEELEELFFGLW